MTVYITFTSFGADAGPFNLYSDVDGYTTPFEVLITQAQLLTGFASSNVPNSTTIIRAISYGECTNSVDMPVLPPLTTTTTTCAAFLYNVQFLACSVCGAPGGGGTISNTNSLTVGKYYLHPSVNLPMIVTGFNSCVGSGLLNILDSTKKDTCPEIICQIFLFRLYSKGGDNSCVGDGTYLADVYGIGMFAYTDQNLFTDPACTIPFNSTGLVGPTSYFKLKKDITPSDAIIRFIDNVGRTTTDSIC
jgi:hypothetical protein